MDMAKRNYSKRTSMSKIEPAVQTLYTTMTARSGFVDHHYLDLSQCASLMNRRFYRQGINWAVAGIRILSASGVTGQVSTWKLPNTWVLSNSWEKSFRTWTKMNNMALSESPSVRPKFLDFKIYADDQHHQNGFGANMLPVGYTGAEWSPSKVYPPNGPNFPGNTSEFEIVAVGANYPGVGASGLNAVSMIEGYAASRGLPNQLDPNTPDDALDADGSTPENWMSAIFNEGTDQDSEVLTDMITENNVAPYPFEGGPNPLTPGIPHPDTMYPGGANQFDSLELHSFDFITGTTIGGDTRIRGSNFPCGLIKFDTSDFSSTSGLIVLIDLVPGEHRGYLCEPMTEM